ncbi:hypothetical protein ACIBK8_08170 [Streptomyces sp. NPDC050161]|uniref:hypothetical protein n=1 Tax=Streptomyces sp. NPDC050161 TaxID=3365604 RepID=UPI0037AA6B3C
MTVLAVVVVATATGCMTVSPRPAPDGPRRAAPPPSVEPTGSGLPTPAGERSGPRKPGTPPDRPGAKDRRKPPGHGHGARDRGMPGGATSHGRGRFVPAPGGNGPVRQGGGAARPAPTRAPRLGGLPAGADPCALGRTYGHWQQGGAANRICRQTYGG